MSIVETDATVSEAWDSRAWTWWSSPSAQSQQLVARCKSISKLAPYWNNQTCFWLELGFFLMPNVPKEDLCRRHSSPVFPVDLVYGTSYVRRCLAQGTAGAAGMDNGCGDARPPITDKQRMDERSDAGKSE